LLYISDRRGRAGTSIRSALSGAGRPRGSPVRLTTGLGAQGISVSPDGTRLAYAVFAERSNVWVAPRSRCGDGDVSISRALPVTTGNQTIEEVALSPDGSWLAFDSDRSGAQQIYRVRLAGGEPEQLTSDSAGAFFFRDGHPTAGRSHFTRSAGAAARVRDARRGRDAGAGHDGSGRSRGAAMVARWPAPPAAREPGLEHPSWRWVTRHADGGWSAPQPLPLVVGQITMQPGIGLVARRAPDRFPLPGGTGRAPCRRRCGPVLVPAPSPTFTAWSAPPLQWSPIAG